jgi:hypothetical protein
MFVLLAGRANPIIRILIGVAGIGVGLFLHAYLLTACGAVMLAWGGIASLRRMRSRGSVNDGGLTR